ncbi:hypothetical protein [Pedobacter frigoris]|uniref:hypothetical protein n=1 Tax=Pedobacter frigoris TaxID=2571272 RepID=UPI00292EF2D0|nr:hypothetical protein [Pedobacter frigoris]
METKLLNQFREIGKWYEFQRTHPKVEYGDSLVKANQLFQSMLAKYGNDPGTLGFDFKALKKSGVSIVSSDDGLFRIYSWDTLLGGTMHIYYNVYQYKIRGKVWTKAIVTENFDAGKLYSKIYTLYNDGKLYYLGIGNSVFSTKDSRQGISVFRINDVGLDDQVKLIKTKSGLTNKLSLDYDFFSVVDRPERPVSLITYNKDSKMIKLALVDEKHRVTNKFITYKFTGKYFERL